MSSKIFAASFFFCGFQIREKLMLAKNLCFTVVKPDRIKILVDGYVKKNS